MECVMFSVFIGHCNPFAVLEVGNTRVRTQTLYRTHGPVWDKKFNL